MQVGRQSWVVKIFRNKFKEAEQDLYSCKLIINCCGLDDVSLSVLKGVPPLPRFTHCFQPLKPLRDLPRRDRQIVILDEGAGLSEEDLCAFVGEGAKRILCTSRPEDISEKDLALWDDVWIKPLTPSVLRFRFQHVLREIQAEKDLWTAQNQLNQTIDPLPDLIWYKDLKGAHVKVNDAFCQVVGKTKEDVQGRGHYYIWGQVDEEHTKLEYACLKTDEEVIRERKTCVFDEELMGPEGPRRLKTYKTPLFDEDGTVIGTVGVARDMTKELKFQQQLLEIARQDALTGLASRWYFQNYMQAHQDEEHVACVYLDLDHFKEVNDTWGHQTGDAALAATAEMMQHNFPDAFIARLGGDEFMMVFLGDLSLEDLKGRVDQFIQDMAAYFHSSDRTKNLTVSGGITKTTESETGSAIDHLIHRSDLALYQAKHSGRACCVIYDPSMEKERRVSDKGAPGGVDRRKRLTPNWGTGCGPEGERDRRRRQDEK